MKRPDTILDEIHATRRKLYEATKDMTSSERTIYFNRHAETVARQYGFKIVTSTNETDRQETRG